MERERFYAWTHGYGASDRVNVAVCYKTVDGRTAWSQNVCMSRDPGLVAHCVMVCAEYVAELAGVDPPQISEIVNGRDIGAAAVFDGLDTITVHVPWTNEDNQ